MQTSDCPASSTLDGMDRWATFTSPVSGLQIHEYLSFGWDVVQN